jgi:Nickel responsive protein SCO4226-like
METFVIRRRNAWRSPQELEAAAAKSRRIGDQEMPDKVRWIRSYVVKEADGTLGTACIYQAVSPEAIRQHAGRVGMPADEIIPVAATVVVREDPKEAKAA